jgi:uncharacterized protein (TIGR03790 family)
MTVMRRFVCVVVISLVWAGTARAELTPAQVAIIAVRSSTESRALADYYAKARGIPQENILLLDDVAGEVLPRSKWNAQVRPAIRRWLRQEGRETKIRCLVTVWDVPLKIGPLDRKSAEFEELAHNLDRLGKSRREFIVQLAAEIDSVLPATDKGSRAAPSADAQPREFATYIESVLKGAQTRANELKESRPAVFAEAVKRLELLYQRSGGTVAMVRALQQQVEGNPQPQPELVRAFDFRRGEYVGYRGALNLLLGLPESPERDEQIVALMQQSDGVPAALAWVEEQAAQWEKDETYASFDSELTLIHFNAHPLLRWYPNLLHYNLNQSAGQTAPPVLMVARLDGPDFEQVKKLVDTSIAIEKNGLAGKVYLDARGLADDKKPGSYGDYDQSLRELEKFLKQNTTVEVVLNNEDRLFQKGDCPNAALYCGWYSLANYVDAFEWRPGAVGYHMASGEAKTLRNTSSNVWCKRMLEDGVCATLGPVYEPYLTAFPRPLDFFPMLLAGRHTLAEVYARTSPFSSWTMVLIGDPLYNPYKNNPAVDVEKLPPQLR